MIATRSTPRFRFAILALAAGLCLAGCSEARYVFNTADPRGDGPAASPALPAESLDAWRAARPDILAAVEQTLFGGAPAPGRVKTISRRLADPQAFDGAGRLEEIELELSGGDLDAPLRMTLALALPNGRRGPAPVILIPNECGNAFALQRPDLRAAQAHTLPYCRSGGFGAAVGGFLFGRYVLTPPAEDILRAGYAIAAWHESDVAPDHAEAFAATLQTFGARPETEGRPGVIALWAWTMSRVIDHLEDDPRTGATAAFGHSRRGKAVLLAAARDPRIAAIIAHQSGTGGASLHGDGVGEPLASITQSYPHWFGRDYAAYAGREAALPVDAHHVLALIAPRPVLLGNARRDTWSDPAGAFRAAEAASQVWRLYGEVGLTVDRLTAFDPAADLAFHMRPGTHGVTPEDWAAFLAFLEARPETAPAPPSG
jgi:hypothetical protein